MGTRPIATYTVGRELRELRLKRGLTQSELALKAGVSRTLVALVEEEVQLPSFKTLTGIVAALDAQLLIEIND